VASALKHESHSTLHGTKLEALYYKAHHRTYLKEKGANPKASTRHSAAFVSGIWMPLREPTPGLVSGGLL
jgi:hypothetical protein